LRVRDNKKGLRPPHEKKKKKDFSWERSEKKKYRASERGGKWKGADGPMLGWGEGRRKFITKARKQ